MIYLYIILLCWGFINWRGRLQTLCNIKVNDIKDNGTIKLYDFKNESEYYGFQIKSLKNELLEFIKKTAKKLMIYFKLLKQKII